MATIAKLEAVLMADTKHFDRGMASSESRMHKVGKVAGVVGLAIVGGLAVGLEKSVHAAIDAQASQARLEQAFKNVHIALGPYRHSIDEAEKAGRKLGFTDTETRQGLGSLIVSTGSYRAALRQLAIAQDLARFKGVGLTDATKALTMAHAGSLRPLKQLGIDIHKSTVEVDTLKAHTKVHTGAVYENALATARLADKQHTFAEVLRTVTGLTKGQGEAFAGTAAGGAAQFHAQIEHLQATLGEKLLPALTKVLAKVTAFISYLSAHPKVAYALAAGLAVAAVAMMALAISTAAFNIAATPEIALVAGIIVLIVALAAAFAYAWRHSERFRDIVKIVISTVVGYFKDVVANAMSMASGVAGAFHTIEAAIKSLINWVRDLIHWISHIVGKVIDISIHVSLPGGKAGKALDLILSGAKNLAFGMTGIHRAMGGPVNQGKAYMVGEQGPEMFVPRSAGTIIPNGGGAVNVYLTNHGVLGRESEVFAWIQNAAQEFKRRNGRGAF